MESQENQESKVTIWWQSRTLWSSVIYLAGVYIAAHTGYQMSPEVVATILVIINIVLRSITKTPIQW